MNRACTPPASNDTIADHVCPGAEALLAVARTERDVPSAETRARVLAQIERRLTTAPTTMDLARAASEGDDAATSRLLKELAPRIASVVRAVLGNANPDKDDVVQQALLAFVRALPAFRGECDPKGYAGRIAARTAMAARRRARAAYARTGPNVFDETTAPAEDPLPDERAASGRRAEVVRELLETLPEEQAECLAMRVVLGWSLEEIAASFGVPANTVRSRMRLAKEAMRRRIDADPRLLDELER